jgi:CheY-like chemotaxis protein
VHETIRQAIDLVRPSASDAHVAVRSDAIDERVHVWADRQRLEQVLLNLLSNGVKYNRTSGAVTVSCVEVAGSRLRIAPVGPAATEAPRPLEAQKILYIEDNLSNLALVEGILARRPGTTVLSAMQGRVGVDLARDHRPALILLDRHLPDIPGEEVFRLLRADERTRDIPVIVLSADAMPSRMRQFLDGGVRAYLTKPLDVPALLATIDETLRGDARPDPS